MASTNAKRQAVTWCLHWFTGAVNQAERVGSTGQIGDRETEFLLFVTALRNALRSAGVVLGYRHSAVMRFYESCPELKNLRDLLEHHDEYLRGEGDLQEERRAAKLPPFFTTMVSGSGGSHAFTVLVDTSTEPGGSLASYSVDVKRSIAAALDVVRQVVDYVDKSAEPESLVRARAFVER